MLRLVVEAGYEEYLQDNFANYRNRLDDLEQLAIFAQQFPNTEEFLAPNSPCSPISKPKPISRPARMMSKSACPPFIRPRGWSSMSFS